MVDLANEFTAVSCTTDDLLEWHSVSDERHDGGICLLAPEITFILQPPTICRLPDSRRHQLSAIALSSALPNGVDTFGFIDNIWVTAPRFAVPLAMMLRQSLIDLAGTRLAVDGRRTKTEMVYQYLTGPQFRQHIEAIIERFCEMQADLDRERRATMRLWAKREAQLNGVISDSTSFYGEIEGIAGRAMPELESLDLAVC